MHCTKEHLAAYLDGELNALGTWLVKRHLQACGACRTQLASCEQELQQDSLQVPQSTDSESDWKLGASCRLRHGIQRIERTLTTPAKPRQRAVWVTAALCCLAFGAVFFDRNAEPRDALPRTEDVIARTVAVDQEMFRNPVQQDISVEIEQVRPKRVARSGHLHAWSDSATERFAATWTDSKGGLKQGVWKPGTGSAPAYVASVSQPGLRRVVAGTDRMPILALTERGIDPDQVQRMFLEWLEARAWRPLSFSADLAIWAKEDGTVLKIERVGEAASSPRFRITARKVTPGRRVAVMTLEVDAKTYRPQLETIRFASESSEVELRLLAIHASTMARVDLQESIFRPPTAYPLDVSEPSAPAFAHQSPLIRLTAGSPTHNISEQIRTAVDAHYALHLAGACMGNPVEIVENATGVLVRKRGGAGEEPPSILTANVSLAEALAALADLRRSTPDRTGDPEHLRALEALSQRFSRAEIELMDDKARKVLARMVAAHRNAIAAQLNGLAKDRLEHVDRSFQNLSAVSAIASGSR